MENQAKKCSLRVHVKELGRKFNRAGKKKSFWITAVIITVLIIAMVVGLIVRAKGKSSQAAEMTVQSATAEKGSISTTVAGTGTLGNGTTTDVVVPTGIKVKEVLVESGDTVEEGQTLATLDEASIAGELLEVKESKASVQEQIDSLSSEAEDSGTTEYLALMEDSGTAQSGVRDNPLTDILHYIQNHLTEDLSMDTISGAFIMDKYNLAHMFKDKMGISYYQYVLQQRLLTGKNLILEGIPANKACFACGFNDYSSFFRAFKKEYEVSPAAFRRIHEGMIG